MLADQFRGALAVFDPPNSAPKGLRDAALAAGCGLFAGGVRLRAAGGRAAFFLRAGRWALGWGGAAVATGRGAGNGTVSPGRLPMTGRGSGSARASFGI